MDPHYLTASIAAIPCEVKHLKSDFVVEEVPAFLPCGEGQHLWMWIEKQGMTTDAALGMLGRCLGVGRRKFRIGGKKDARAITRQWVSLDLPPKDFAERLSTLGGEGNSVRVLETTMHRTAYGLGRTFGNRFRIRLRHVPADRVADLKLVLGELERRGVPNYFGEQRFGHRGDTDRVGEAIWRDRDLEAVELICGRPSDEDTGRWLDARKAFDEGDFELSKRLWTASDFAPKQLLQSLIRGGSGLTEQSATRAIDSIDRRDLSFFMSAYQARLFNEVLSRRVAHLDKVLVGDLALRLPRARRSFLVEDLALEQGRADAGEITASGPLFGPEMPNPMDRPAEMELEVLRENGWNTGCLDATRGKLCPGGRRPLLIPLLDLSVTELEAPDDGCVALAFQLPKGCFATTVLAEIHKGLRGAEVTQSQQ